METARIDRKSTRLNSSHSSISYAVFCLKKKNTKPVANVNGFVVESAFCSEIFTESSPGQVRARNFVSPERIVLRYVNVILFFFNDTATTEIYTLSLHDALPISTRRFIPPDRVMILSWRLSHSDRPDRKSTRLNPSHSSNSYAVFCLKTKNQ